MSLRVVCILASRWLGDCNCIALVSVNVCSPPSVDVAVLGCIFDISRLVSPSSVYEGTIDVCDSLGWVSGVVAIKGTWSTSFFFFFPSFYNVEFKAVCIKDGFLKVFFIYENISKDMYIYSVRNNDKIIPLCAHYSA